MDLHIPLYGPLYGKVRGIIYVLNSCAIILSIKYGIELIEILERKTSLWSIDSFILEQ